MQHFFISQWRGRTLSIVCATYRSALCVPLVILPGNLPRLRTKWPGNERRSIGLAEQLQPPQSLASGTGSLVAAVERLAPRDTRYSDYVALQEIADFTLRMA
jgi:hypothetical protein